MRCFKPITFGALTLVAVASIGADTDGFLCQMITLPSKGMRTRFADLNGHGRLDLLAVDSAGKELLIYRQRADGFGNTPDQIIELPPNAGWIAPDDVEGTVNSISTVAARERRPTMNNTSRKSFDLLVSTATGLDYYRQVGGVFEPKPRVLLKARQVFTGGGSPALLLRLTNGIPVISATQAWLYQRNDESEWTSGPPTLLKAEHGGLYGTRNQWSMGQTGARTLEVDRNFLSMPQPSASYPPENDGIAKLMSILKRTGLPAVPPGSTEVDLEGDGRKDLIIWQVNNQSFQTDFYVFLRGASGQLPERPSQILHCRGVPIPVNSTWSWAPIADLKGDGRHELVLVEPDFIVTSIGSLVDMALTRGVRVAVTVRPFSHGAFARSGEKSITFLSQLSLFGSAQWPFFICGDFNGDGRPDLVVMRSATEWEIYYSTGDGHWFDPRPAVTFELPAQGYFERHYFEILDLSGDGRSDIVSHILNDPRIFILLNQPENSKGNP